MKAHRCDRCKKFFEERSLILGTEFLGKPDMGGDLCPRCVKSLREVMVLWWGYKINEIPEDSDIENLVGGIMGHQECFLISIFYEGSLLKCALKVRRDALSEDCIDNPMEPENRKTLRDLLPFHVKACGPVVDVEPLFEVSVIGGK
ncbi:MAG: hypothetical protein V3U84_06730 [Thiotrichaceae bacterium]